MNHDNNTFKWFVQEPYLHSSYAIRSVNVVSLTRVSKKYVDDEDNTRYYFLFS